MLTIEECRELLGTTARGWPDSKIAEFQRRADILTDVVIDMYLDGAAAGPLDEARALVPDEVGDELTERAAVLEYDAGMPRGKAERTAVIEHVQRQRR